MQPRRGNGGAYAAMPRLLRYFVAMAGWMLMLLTSAHCAPGPSAPLVTAVEPATILAGESAAIVIRGEFFFDAHISFAPGVHSHVDTRFRAYLGAVPLRDVRFVDSETLLATVPGHLPRGQYSLKVQDPAGRSGVLESAVQIAALCEIEQRCHGGMPAIARFSATPWASTPGSDILLSAESTTHEGSDDELAFAWYVGDAVEPFAVGKEVTWTTADVGIYDIHLIVENQLALVDHYTAPIIIQPEESFLHVSNAADLLAPEDDSMSLRKAVAQANEAGATTIVLPANTTFELDSVLVVTGDAIDIVGAVGTRIVGDDEICLDWQGQHGTARHLDIEGCQTAMRLASNSVVASHNTFRGIEVGVAADGNMHHIGPANAFLEAAGTALLIVGGDEHTIRGNVLFSNGTGVRTLGASTFSLWQNIFASNQNAVEIQGGGAKTIWHNTFFGNVQHAIHVGHTTGPPSLDVRNNIFAMHGGYALAGRSHFSALDFNAYFGNAQGNCERCAVGDASVSLEPSFAASDANDFRLLPTCVLRDAGTPLPLDVNGPLRGDFNGPAPDIGAWEAPE